MIADMPPIEDLSWPKVTARLSLRPGVEEDLEPLWQIRRQESVGRWMTELSVDLDAFVATSLEIDRLASTLVIERDGVIVGDLMLRIEDAWAQSEVKEQAVGVQAEIGWCIDPALEGHGFATEAVVELIRIGFVDLGLRRLTALCFADNEASWRLMERVGMRREAHNVADSLHRTGGWLDGYLYALLDTEWRAAAAT